MHETDNMSIVLFIIIAPLLLITFVFTNLMITDILQIINVYFKYNDGKMDGVLFMMNETLPSPSLSFQGGEKMGKVVCHPHPRHVVPRPLHSHRER